MVAPGENVNSNGTSCYGNCTTGYSSTSLANVDSMIVSGSLDGFLQWLPRNGTPNSPGSQGPLSPLWKYGLGGPNGSNNYCGPGGAGAPANGNDWACATHDYNYLIGGGLGKQYSIFDKSGAGSLSSAALVDADHVLANNVSGPEGAVIKTAVSAMDLKRLVSGATF
jgi:hypothetical protein